jgi:GMP synthase (glutamine-hydrolysing)
MSDGVKPIVILRAGSTFPALKNDCGDFDNWIAQGLADPAVESWDVVNAIRLPARDEIAGAVITGSHAMVTDREAWSESLAEWIRQMHQNNLPLLGICYGHQLIAHALGGEVDYRQQGREIGTHKVIRCVDSAKDPLMSQLPTEFDAHLVHSQSVIRLPETAVKLASSAEEPHQSYRVGETTWGVQFHPEFNERVMHYYIEQIGAANCSVRPTIDAASLLARFARIAREKISS